MQPSVRAALTGLSLALLASVGCGGGGGGSGGGDCVFESVDTSGTFTSYCWAFEPGVAIGDGAIGYQFRSSDGVFTNSSNATFTPTLTLDVHTRQLTFQGSVVGSLKAVRYAGKTMAGLVGNDGRYLDIRVNQVWASNPVPHTVITSGYQVATLATPPGGASAYAGPYANYVSYLLAHDPGWTATTPPPTHTQVCMRDAYVDAAATYAWAASAYAAQGNSAQAADSATQAYANLQNANSLCSNVPPPAGSPPCSTLSVWGCPAPF